jgi:predicted nucleic-acid-binding protein
VKITADTNVLVRAVTADDAVQSPLAQRLLVEAELVAISLPSLCEFCWVLDRVYGFGGSDIARAIRAFLAADNVAVDIPGVEAGLAILEAGGDFADGLIAHEGKWLGAERFASFDKKAVALLHQAGEAVLIPG